jgi:hypothetical protein
MPLRIEEGEWPPMAAAIADTGKPLITATDSHKVRLLSTLQPDPSPMIGAWHPPLYLYTLAATMLVAGTDSSQSLRAIGGIALLTSALLLLLIAREVTPRWRLVGGVAAVLLLLHPYAIQGSLFLDIDNSIYAPLTLLVLWLAIRFGTRRIAPTPVQLAAIGGSLALLTWAKMTTTIILLAVLIVWWLLVRRPFLRATFEALCFTAVGAALFFSSYALWCKWADIPFRYTFQVTFVQKSDRLLSEWWLTDNAAHWHLRWFGAAVFVLAALYAIDLARHLFRTRRLRALDLLYLFAIAVLVNYIILSPTDGTYQGKYAMPAVAALLLPLAWMVLREEHSVRASPARWAAATIIAIAAAALAPDLITHLAVNGNYGNWQFDLVVIAGAALALAAAWVLGGRQGFGGGVIVVLALVSVAQGIHSYRANHSPLYPVSDTSDFRAGADDLNARLSSDQIVLTAKDLGFYVDGPVIEGEDAFARGDALLAEALRTNRQIVAVARDSFGPPMGAETLAVVDTCFLQRRSYGSVSLAYRDRACK